MRDRSIIVRAAMGKNPWEVVPAEWSIHGKVAGPIRNKEMAEYDDPLIPIWDGQSRGTKNMIETMQSAGKPVYVHRY